MFVIFHWDDFFKLKMCSAISNEVCNSGTHSVGWSNLFCKQLSSAVMMCHLVYIFPYGKIIHFPPFYDPLFILTTKNLIYS